MWTVCWHQRVTSIYMVYTFTTRPNQTKLTLKHYFETQTTPDEAQTIKKESMFTGIVNNLQVKIRRQTLSKINPEANIRDKYQTLKMGMMYQLVMVSQTTLVVVAKPKAKIIQRNHKCKITEMFYLDNDC